MTGVSAVSSGDLRGEHSLASLLRGEVTTGQMAGIEKPLHRRLLEAALNYIREAKIYFPHVTLEVRNDDVVMHGVPHTGQLLVCAVNDGRIDNHL